VPAALAARKLGVDFPVGDWIEGVVRRGVLPVEGGVTWRTDPRLRWPSGHRLNAAQAEAALGRIAAPVLFVQALQGLAIPTDFMQRMLGAVKTIEVARLPGGHHLHLEHAGAVGDVVANFLAG
jgi:pimeloyl-ACP methyl ester carboxylesterase